MLRLMGWTSGRGVSIASWMLLAVDATAGHALILTFADLPVPAVSLPKSAKASAPPQEPSTSAMPPPTLHAQPTPSRTLSAFGAPEADPWGSPDLHKGHNHANGTEAPPTARTTSQFTTNSTSASTSHQENIQPSSMSSEGWGGFNGGANQPFATPGLDDNGFGAAPVGGGSNPPPERGRSIGRAPGASGTEEVITITAIAEKEGVFLFQHRNYEVASSKRTTKVVRRYSDFVWLLDCLHKRYPFRQLPLLPPKRVGSEFP
jgi:sorting nexin-8